MTAQQEIEASLKRVTGLTLSAVQWEVKELPGILGETEPVLDAVSGTYENGNGLLVATDRRVIFVDKGLVGSRVEDFPYDKITSLQYQTGLLLGTLTIFASGNRAEIRNVAPKHNTRLFAEGVRERMGVKSGVDAQQQTNGQDGQPPVDYLDQLERLGALKDKGVLTEDEFDRKKKEILGF